MQDRRHDDGRRSPPDGVQVARERQGIGDVGDPHGGTVDQGVDFGRAAGVGAGGEQVTEVVCAQDRTGVALLDHGGYLDGEGDLVGDHRPEVVGDADHLAGERIALAGGAAEAAVGVLREDQARIVDSVQAAAIEVEDGVGHADGGRNLGGTGTGRSKQAASQQDEGENARR